MNLKNPLLSVAKLCVAALISSAVCMPLGGCLANIKRFSKGGDLSKADIVAGLKEALKKGIDTGVATLSKKDGYYASLSTRIGLPPEALVITENIAKLPGGQKMVDEVVKSINAAASDAASEAVPIFASALKSMTIVDGAKLLINNNKTAATDYFRSKTKTQLKGLFAKYIDKSLKKKIIGSVSAQSSWNTLTTSWNKVANSAVGKAGKMKTVNTNLCDYLTEQAVERIFMMVGEQEKKIRANVSARTTPLLKKVFAAQ